MDIVRNIVDSTMDKVREVTEDIVDARRGSGLSTMGALGRRSDEPEPSRSYSSGRGMQGFGSDNAPRPGNYGGRYESDGPRGSDFQRDLHRFGGEASRQQYRGTGPMGGPMGGPLERTAIGAPKIETGYYSTGKMQGFGSDDVRRGMAPVSTAPASSGYGRDRYSGGGGGGGGGGDSYSAALDRQAARLNEREEQSRRYASRADYDRDEPRGGYASRAAYDRDERSGGGHASRAAYDHDERHDERRGSEGGEPSAGAADDDDGHGAEAWTSQVDWAAEQVRSKYDVKIRAQAPVSAPEPPKVPPPKVVGGRAIAAPSRTRPQSGAAPAPAPPPDAPPPDLLGGLDDIPDPFAAAPAPFASTFSPSVPASVASAFGASAGPFGPSPSAPFAAAAADPFAAAGDPFGAAATPFSAFETQTPAAYQSMSMPVPMPSAPAPPAFAAFDTSAAFQPMPISSPMPTASVPGKSVAELKKELAAAVADEDYAAAAEIKKAIKAAEEAEKASASAREAAARLAERNAARLAEMQAKLARMQAEVAQAVEAEDYEKAAELKPQIKQLKATLEAAAVATVPAAAAGASASASAPKTKDALTLDPLASKLVNLGNLTAPKEAPSTASPSSKTAMAALKPTASSASAPPAHPDLAGVTTVLGAMNVGVGMGGGGMQQQQLQQQMAMQQQMLMQQQQQQQYALAMQQQQMMMAMGMGGGMPGGYAGDSPLGAAGIVMKPRSP